MGRSNATTVDGYLKELPAERRAVLESLIALVRKHLPAGYEEGMGFGMITYSVPLSRYPVTANGQPLLYAAVAAQKHHYAIYLMSVYGGHPVKLEEAFAREGKKLDMGKSCVRFKSLDDISVSGIGSAIAYMTPDAYIAWYEQVKGLSPGT